RPKPLVDP
nr:Chain C, Serine/threonine-protein kinase PAK 4 [Homo sapiens]4FIF_D Chain D, Serine/threonine-protein kinase PAK 4 [Homo sapiens]4FII_B Chain B, Serine/threonine-protein kinase PAK 4 [Homo sapiens]